MGPDQIADRSGSEAAMSPAVIHRRRRLAGLAVLCLGALSGLAPAEAADWPRNVVLVAVARELLFFSATSGQWTSARLDAGERVLQGTADGNVAAVVTSQRVFGFSAVLNQLQEVRVPEDEGLEAFRAEGNVASVLTRRRALGFSAVTGRWNEVERFLIGGK
jgi:hypothetical protein